MENVSRFHPYGLTSFINQNVVLFFNNPELLTTYSRNYAKQLGTDLTLTPDTQWIITAVDQQGITCQLAKGSKEITEVYFYFPWTLGFGIFYTPALAERVRRVG